MSYLVMTSVGDKKLHELVVSLLIHNSSMITFHVHIIDQIVLQTSDAASHETDNIRRICWRTGVARRTINRL